VGAERRVGATVDVFPQPGFFKNRNEKDGMTTEPERIDEPKPAGLPRRLAALAYDFLLLGGVLVAYTFVVLAVRGGEAVPPGTGWFELSLAALCVAFFVWFWTHGGQTLGMLAFGLRVVVADGRPVGVRAALVRAAASLVSALPAGLGFWWALVDSERRCWHDRLSGTRVVREPRRNTRRR
jgi:uncharacterized RDD family membrane protein YckC